MGSNNRHLTPCGAAFEHDWHPFITGKRTAQGARVIKVCDGTPRSKKEGKR